MFKTLNFNGRG